MDLNYFRLAEKYHDHVAAHKLYEYAAAIKYGGLVWEDIPYRYKDEREWYNDDTGIDVYAKETDTAIQAKFYDVNTRISWDCIAKFLCTAKLSNPLIKNAILVSPTGVSASRRFDTHFTREYLTNEEFEIIAQTAVAKYAEYMENVQKIIESNEPLYPCQISAIETVKSRPFDTTRIQMACGSGKTRLQAEIIRYFGGRSIVLVPTRELMQQTNQMLFEYGIPNAKVGTDYTKNIDMTAATYVCVYNSAWRLSEITFDTVIIDEAHHAELPEIYQNDENFDENSDESEDEEDENSDENDESEDEEDENSDENNENEDELSENSEIDDEIDEKLNELCENLDKLTVNKYVSAKKLREIPHKRLVLMSATIDNADYSYTIPQAISDGILCDFDIYIPIFAGENYARLAEYVKKRVETGIFRRILIYSNRVETAKLIAEKMNEVGVSCGTFDGTTTKNRRREIIAAYTEGRLNALSTVNTIGEGFNVRDSDTCIIAEPRDSEISVVQMIGRILRHSTSGAKSIGHVVIPCFARVDEPDVTASVQRIVEIVSQENPYIRECLRAKRRTNAVRVDGEYESAPDSDFLREFVSERVSVILTSAWDAKYTLLCEFANVNGRVPKKRESCNGIAIGLWVQRQRKQYMNGKLTADRITLLNSISNWVWQVKDTSENAWRLTYDILCHFIEINNRLPYSSELFNNIPIGSWVRMQRKNKKKNTLTADRVMLLNRVTNWSWDLFNDTWYNSYNALCRFVEINNRLPYLSESFNDVRIGGWISHQRQNYKKGTLTADRVALLNKISNWVWYVGDTPKNVWRLSYDTLCRFVEINNRLPYKSESSDSIAIGRWICTQRKNYAKGKLTDDRIVLLKSIPDWSWDPFNDAWRSSYDTLCQFVQEYNRLPYISESSNNIAIGQWISRQRQNYKKGTLIADRVALLNIIPNWI